jgi:predicted transcriptional regulator
MAFHQGSRLKKIIEKSDFNISQIVKKSGIANSSIYGMFEKEELVRSKILPILDVLKMTYEEFMGNATSTELEDLKKENDRLKTENIQLLKDKINLLERIEDISKMTKKTRVVA